MEWTLLVHGVFCFRPCILFGLYFLTKRFEEFEWLNVQLIGLSIDQVFSHIKWVEWINEKLGLEIKFPIIADTGEIAKKYGMIRPGKGTNTVRAVFIIDLQGVLRAALYYPQEIGRNIDEILRVVKGSSDLWQARCSSASKPNNELIGDKAIILPATRRLPRRG